MRLTSRIARAIVVLALALPLGAAAADPPKPARDPLPPPAVTEQAIEIDGRRIAFKATASTAPVKDGRSGETLADIALLTFTVEPKPDSACRPVVFAFNGGPGASSAWLDLGAVGPWRLPLAGAVPSTPPRLIDNAESWLTFADLVFLDPPGTGYAPPPTDDAARKRLLSVDGDVEALAIAIRRWTAREHRQSCARYLLGESYGGFRAPRIARALQEKQNLGVDGLILISPVLDFSWIEGRSPLLDAARLPSLAASRTGARTRAALAEAETYAREDYLRDLLRGPQDEAALERVSSRVAALTGLPQDRVRRLGGRIGASDWARESDPSGRAVASPYDGGVRGLDPAPGRDRHDWPDPVLDALRAPLAEAMTRLTTDRLKWPVEDLKYEILNDRVARDWDWGPGRQSQEALSDLRYAMALDPRLRVLVAHGLSDLVTPYFATRLLLDQSAAVGAPDRIGFLALAGGHMFYAEDESRAALRDAARKLIEGR
ncbi:Carboxypeptidase C (cathepsin A) [Rhodoblastus acidophilus]|uniref:Carboxypeptidase C (Cathepsin A) n=1 Tax=Rhodoblastus acidophilus TaxID=1074 RepID=A0A212PYQ6_RHOAC|nr:peptidase S10 [Rhodoblastus acidophilus]PPQ38702.1 hypothetical protein CKO16_08790 [Rhodoblastus acidophilus]RAI21157.1 hypothetical protein CH337_07970 [Rhodoblastus acidophilus]SNB52241.1 Carboxypeptidase C (cathepsin A) [Rhodoblastus acidophilus]